MMMMLHAGQSLAPHDAWRAWSIEPGVVIPLVLACSAYAIGAREGLARSTRGQALLRREIAYFTAGLLVLSLALLSPLHRTGGVLFSAHMIQHELLMAVAAPLLVLGRPGVPFLWGLPATLRHSAASAVNKRAVRGSWYLLTRPAVAFLLHAAAIWIWHSPSLYDASVTSEIAHSAQHLSFLGTALLFWWSLLHTRGRVSADGSAIIYLFATAVHTSLLGVLLTVSDRPWYLVYHDASTMAWGLTALEDQQLGGIIMWVPAGLVYMIAAAFLMLGWLRESKDRADARDDARGRGPASRAGGRLARGAAVFIAVVHMSGCADHDKQWAAQMTGGSSARGQTAIRSYGCQSCHTIPGIQGAQALVGPPLAGIASRSYIAGVMSNTPTHMIEWLRDPPGIDSLTAMPNMNVTERDARDIAAYLYTLR